MVVAFPIAKLAYLLVRQIGKPFATRIKERAKTSEFFRNNICMPPAQFYHWIEVNIKMRMLNLGKPTEVPKLNEAMAIELGAELLGEGIIFVVAAGCLVAEYRRSSNKEREKEAAKEATLLQMSQQLTEVELRLEAQETRIRELSRMTFGIQTSFGDWWSWHKKSDDSLHAGKTSEADSSRPQKDIIVKALENVSDSVRDRKGST